MKTLARVTGIDGLDDPGLRDLVRAGLLLAMAAVAIRLFFWAYTGRLWEDALITILHAENAARGLGMTHYHAGQPPLHGFTSPLSVLVPLLGDLFRLGWGFNAIRIAGALCGGLAVLYALGIAIHPSILLPRSLTLLVLGYLAFEHHQILWGMSGMETQIVTAILLASIYFTIAEKPRALGISLGFCMLARPDFAFWTVISGLYVLARRPRTFLTTVTWAVAVYAPWIIFTCIHYGTPIPNTITAKGLGYYTWWQEPGLTFTDIKRNVWDRVTATYLPNTVFQTLGPCFGGHGTGFRALIADHGLIANGMIAAAALGSAIALIRRQYAWWPPAFFVLVYAVYYVFCVPYVFGWYVVPLAAAAVLLSARGLAAITAPWPPLRVPLVLAYLAVIMAMLPITIPAEKRIQEDIENPVRKAMAQYLALTMKPGETVGGEPLGYLSYYSGHEVYDWPGLANRAVVQYSREHPHARTMNDMLEHFRPDYLVLRPYEYHYLEGHKGGWVNKDYELAAEFAANPAAIAYIPLIHTNQDTCFLVLHKRAG